MKFGEHDKPTFLALTIPEGIGGLVKGDYVAISPHSLITPQLAITGEVCLSLTGTVRIGVFTNAARDSSGRPTTGPVAYVQCNECSAKAFQ